MSAQFIHPTAQIDPAARLAENTVVGAEVQIGPQVTAAGGVQIGAQTRIFGVVKLRYGVHIGQGVTLVGPLEIGTDVKIGDGASIGIVRATGSRLDQTVICRDAHIGAKAEVLGRLSIGEYARLAAGARLEGDLLHRGIAAGSPAALMGFVCPCGQPYQLSRAFHELRVLVCPAGHETYHVSVPDMCRQGKFLLPNQQTGEPVPAWWSAE